MFVRISIAISLMALVLAACSSVKTPSNETGTAGIAMPGSAFAGPQMATMAKPGVGLPAPDYSASAADVQYRLGPLDVVNVLVFQVPDLSGDFQVGSDGMLGLPLVGSIRASGRTAHDVQKDITSKLSASYLQQPQVTVKVTEFNSQKVTVDGGVQKPGTFPVESASGTLLEYIALAGGMPRTADTSNVVIFRQIQGKRMAARFDVGQIRDGKLADPIVYGGDVIVVPTSGIRSAWADFLSAMPAASFVATVTGL